MPENEPYELHTFDAWWRLLADDLKRGEGWWSKLSGELSPGGFPLSSTSLKYENSRIVKAGAGTCFGLTGYSSSGSAQFVQVFDRSDLPTTGMVPVAILSVPAASNFSVDWGLFGARWGRAFSRGIVVVNSSTGPTYTAGSADCWFDVQYV